MTRDDQTPGLDQIAEALDSWSAKREIAVVRNEDGETACWTMTPRNAASGGTITVMIRL